MKMERLYLERPIARADETAAPGAPPMDIVFIDGFRGETVIGIHQDELDTSQPVRIDLRIGVPRPRACDTDSISDTIDYGEVRQALRHLLATHRYQLLEAFSEAIARLLIDDFGAHWVRVTASKPAKFDDVDGVGVTIERHRPANGALGRHRRDAEILGMLGSGMFPAEPHR